MRVSPLLVIPLLCGPAMAASGPGQSTGPAQSMGAMRTSAAIRVDGRLDEAA